MEEQNPKHHSDSMVHMVSRSSPQKGKNLAGKGSTFMCIRCGEKVYSKLWYHEIIGYPEWWDFTKKLRKKVCQTTVATAAHTQEVTTPMASHTSANSDMSHHNYTSNKIWIIDTGATDYMSNSSKILTTSYSPKQTSINSCSLIIL